MSNAALSLHAQTVDATYRAVLETASRLPLAALFAMRTLARRHRRAPQLYQCSRLAACVASSRIVDI
jgi:hypothetical protein